MKREGTMGGRERGRENKWDTLELCYAGISDGVRGW